MSTNCICCACVPQQEIALIERCGKYEKKAEPGLSFINCLCCEAVAGTVSLRTRQIIVDCETKTLDDVSVRVETAIQYQTSEDLVYEAFYELSDPAGQIESYVLNVVRATVPKLKLNDVYANKDDIAEDIKTELTEVMQRYGYNIKNSLITDIDPDETVKKSMNEINAQVRLRMAANERAEAEKIVVIKAAEAEAESKALSGEGVARQRKAIIEGLQTTVSDFSENLGTNAADVMNVVLATQYFDALEKISSGADRTVFLPSGGASSAVRDGMLQAEFGQK